MNTLLLKVLFYGVKDFLYHVLYLVYLKVRLNLPLVWGVDGVGLHEHVLVIKEISFIFVFAGLLGIDRLAEHRVAEPVFRDQVS